MKKNGPTIIVTPVKVTTGAKEVGKIMTVIQIGQNMFRKPAVKVPKVIRTFKIRSIKIKVGISGPHQWTALPSRTKRWTHALRTKGPSVNINSKVNAATARNACSHTPSRRLQIIKIIIKIWVGNSSEGPTVLILMNLISTKDGFQTLQCFA